MAVHCSHSNRYIITRVLLNIVIVVVTQLRKMVCRDTHTHTQLPPFIYTHIKWIGKQECQTGNITQGNVLSSTTHKNSFLMESREKWHGKETWQTLSQLGQTPNAYKFIHNGTLLVSISNIQSASTYSYEYIWTRFPPYSLELLLQFWSQNTRHKMETHLWQEFYGKISYFLCVLYVTKENILTSFYTPFLVDFSLFEWHGF